MPKVKTNPPLRVVLAGYGAFGQVHARAWQRHLDGIDLTIAEPDPALRRQAESSFPQAFVVDDPVAALRSADAIDIVTPADTHAALMIAALEAGRHVFVEKPFVLTSAEAHAVASTAASSDRLIQVGYFYRAHPLALLLRNRLLADPEDRPIWIDADFTSLKRPRRDAGVIENDAVHFLDLIRWLIGTPPAEVTALLRHPLQRPFEDAALIALAWPDGLLARLQAACVLTGPDPDPVVPGGWSRKSITVTSRRRQLVADFLDDTLTERPARHVPLADGGWRTEVGETALTTVPKLRTEDVVAAELGRFVAAIRRQGPNIANLDSGVSMVEICEAIHRSARDKRTVAIGSPG